MGVSKFEHIWTMVGKGLLVRMGQTDCAGMGDTISGWMCVRVQV